jgi:hypothetical protein
VLDLDLLIVPAHDRNAWKRAPGQKGIMPAIRFRRCANGITVLYRRWSGESTASSLPQKLHHLFRASGTDTWAQDFVPRIKMSSWQLASSAKPSTQCARTTIKQKNATSAIGEKVHRLHQFSSWIWRSGPDAKEIPIVIGASKHLYKSCQRTVVNLLLRNLVGSVLHP